MCLSSISNLAVVGPPPSPQRSNAAFVLPQDDLMKLRATASMSPNDNASTPSMPSDKLRDALTAFEKEARMTPAERARRDILEDMELTEEALKAMPAGKRNAIEDSIAKEVATQLTFARSVATTAAS
jgi:hypothetical protein